MGGGEPMLATGVGGSKRGRPLRSINGFYCRVRLYWHKYDEFTNGSAEALSDDTATAGVGMTTR